MSRRSRPRVRPEAALQERLDHYTDKSAGPDGCWLWKGFLNEHGYGGVRWQGRWQRAHRLSFEAAKGPIPEGGHILHRCDNPPCVNPAHLHAGSHRDNMRDMYAKGRRRPPAGERNVNAKLTAEMVLAIRVATGSQNEIGNYFGITPATVSKIKLGRLWRHLPASDAMAADRRPKGELVLAPTSNAQFTEAA